MALWAANAEWPRRAQRASLQAFFLGLNCVAAPSLGRPHASRRPCSPGAWLAVGVGVLLGAPLSRRVGERRARRTTLALAGTGGAAVLVRALAS